MTDDDEDLYKCGYRDLSEGTFAIFGEELHLPLSVFANFALAPNNFAFILNRKKCRPADSDDIKRMPLK